VTFVFVGGNLALDLLGTVKWRRTTSEECLGSPADAARWALASGTLTSEPGFSATDLAALLELREAIYRLFRAVMAGDPPPTADLRLVNAAAARPGAAIELTPAGATRVGDATAVAAEVARAARRTARGDLRRQRSAATRMRTPRLHPPVRRPFARWHPRLVRHGRVRQPGQGRRLPGPQSRGPAHRGGRRNRTAVRAAQRRHIGLT
jgi:predicted RNA-binding Zn ribbon-like protein